jgi:hypothetical protein
MVFNQNPAPILGATKPIASEFIRLKMGDCYRLGQFKASFMLETLL